METLAVAICLINRVAMRNRIKVTTKAAAIACAKKAQATTMSPNKMEMFQTTMRKSLD